MVANATNSRLQWDGGWTIGIPISFPSGGKHVVNSSWAFDWSGVTGYSVRRPCTGTLNSSASFAYLSCEAFAGVSWDGITSVVDRTNGSVYWAPTFFPGALNISSWYWHDSCYLGCKITKSATGKNGTTVGPSTFNSTVTVPGVNASHRYSLVIGLTAQIILEVFTLSSGFHGVVRLLGTAHGALNMAPARYGGHLLSIVLI